MVSENPTWGAPRIHGELLKLGFELSERSVSRWIRRAPRDPDSAKRWLTFLRNHREAIAAMDFFTVPTLTFGTGHGRSKAAGKIAVWQCRARNGRMPRTKRCIFNRNPGKGSALCSPHVVQIPRLYLWCAKIPSYFEAGPIQETNYSLNLYICIVA